MTIGKHLTPQVEEVNDLRERGMLSTQINHQHNGQNVLLRQRLKCIRNNFTEVSVPTAPSVPSQLQPRRRAVRRIKIIWYVCLLPFFFVYWIWNYLLVYLSFNQPNGDDTMNVLDVNNIQPPTNNINPSVPTAPSVPSQLQPRRRAVRRIKIICLMVMIQ
eukprot:155528_1